jgi:hypothetical protein
MPLSSGGMLTGWVAAGKKQSRKAFASGVLITFSRGGVLEAPRECAA